MEPEQSKMANQSEFPICPGKIHGLTGWCHRSRTKTYWVLLLITGSFWSDLYG